jgi:leader peptidase (prepilin peptidase)/N-methyltransferase
VIPTGFYAAIAGVFGLAIGSFLNVVIYRVPVGESIVSPPSKCPKCGHEIRNRHNIPVFGWLVLRGKCADCANPISPRYPLVELATGLIFAAITLDVGKLHWALPAYLYFAAAGLALAMIDIDHKRLPDKIVLPSYPVIAALLTIAAAVDHDWSALARAGIGAVALLAFYFLIAFAYPAGMGFGDVKLSGILGSLLAYISWGTLFVGAFGGFLLGALGGVAVLALGRGDRKTAIPFGPFMIAATLLAVFVGARLSHWYQHLTGH